ncbi:transcriptional regulator [Streptomyces sp. P3]|uniref:LCP family protein n=1 Tax=Streptomyces sp. P3 TaxID=2135430 RepID=UPI000D1C0ED6|nr:LCP family protein [Streptomyces sp. P3]AVV42525.1 transcriptional regulator [Streptomyces sp. P3]
MTTKRNLLPRRLAIPSIVLAATGALLGSSSLPGREHAPRAMNVLLMGTDERNTISVGEKHAFHAGGQACGCTDVLMLIHLSARRDRVSVIGLPRDSWAHIPQYRDANGRQREAHPAKINAAFQEGGPELAVRTVEAMTALSVDRFIQVDFRRFMDSVDEVGGVEVCTPRRLTDSATKMDLEPGKHRLGGGQSLQYVRSRHVDTSADLGRIQRQQRFLVQALRKLQERELLADPRRTLHLVRTLLGDGRQGFSLNELAREAAALRRLPNAATEFVTVPIAGFAPASLGIGSALAWDDRKADALFTKLREDRPLVAPGRNPEPKDPPTVVGSTVPVRGSTYACR